MRNNFGGGWLPVFVKVLIFLVVIWMIFTATRGCQGSEVKRVRLGGVIELGDTHLRVIGSERVRK